jgi:hypothetical protein
MWRLSVTDNGPGIPESQLEHIFERFVRGDAGLTQRVGGTGLGLAICKSLVELHGGTIAAESTPGVGSTFSFRLPIAGAPAGARSTAPPRRRADAAGPRRRRLETILLLLRTRLELAGYEVETAADGQEVTERLQGSEPGSRPGPAPA